MTKALSGVGQRLDFFGGWGQPQQPQPQPPVKP
jgi:hypothetical protein